MTQLPAHRLIGIVILAASCCVTPAAAQDQQTDLETAAAEASDAAVAPEDLVPPEDIDALMAPVALYPDSLLAQIFMASTYPLDVVKAARFIATNKGLSGKELSDAVSKTDWDPSVQALAVGFPDIITRMNDNIDWTEQVGDLVLAQTDDVMASVQRLRAEAAETGYLTTNDAQTVNVDVENQISIEPTNPEVIYVPTYNPQVVYTQPAPAEVVYVDNGSGTDWGDVLAAGAIIFGTAMILDEIFDDDDPWDDYWRGPAHVDWDDADFYPRPNVTINGDVNIGSNNNRFTKVDRDTVVAGNKKIGDIDQTQIERNIDRQFRPDAAERDEARQKLAARKDLGQRPTTLPAATRPAGTGATKAPDKMRPSGTNKPVKVDAGAAPAPKKTDKSATSIRKPTSDKAAPKKAPAKSSAFEKSGGSRAKAASERGKSSVKKVRR